MIAHTFDEAFSLVRGLVQDFRQSEAEFLSPGYGEAAVRQDFIDRFWMALGWDVTHETQKNPREREVTVEKDVRVEGRGKRADYSFAVAPNYRDVRFFVEAKKPGRQLDNAQDYFQAIRYGWHARTPVAVLTDFEQFRILDCRYKPDVDAVLDYGALEKFHYTDYADEERFRRIYHLFSRAEVAGGALERYVASLPKQAGRAAQRALFARGAYQSIDESFLQDLDGYREQLARAFHAANPHLDGAQLTEATQRTLDRLVFMRFLEDKLIEPDELVEPLAHARAPWAEFVAASRRLNQVYNGIIFREHPLLDAPGFRVDGRVFAAVCENLSHVRSPYDFNLIPIHILGSIYERFLGKTIEVEAGVAGVKEKPEVRKAGGVYYTPEYVVRYIVGETVGRLIEGKTPEQVRPMRFADISCGSGSFLLGVYDLLLDHHERYYNRNKRTRAEGLKAGCVETEEGALRLSLLQKRTILLNNVYGVDVDAQAVEVAQLSLYLKLLEEETTASARSHQLAFREALLPSLNKNVVRGNSLVDFDILTSHLFNLAPEEELKINPMSFAQTFPRREKEGFFDAVVGNPPYVLVSEYLYPAAVIKYLNSYEVAEYKVDLFHLFIQRAIDLLVKGGRLGYIVPNPWLTLKFTGKLRKYVVEKTTVSELVVFNHEVFAAANVFTALLMLEKHPPDPGHEVLVKRPAEVSDAAAIKAAPSLPILQRTWAEAEGYIFETRLSGGVKKLVERLTSAFPRLDTVARASLGCQAYNSSKHTKEQIAKRVFHSTFKKGEEYLPELAGSDVSRYEINRRRGEWIKYGPWLHDYRTLDWLQGPRILVREIPGQPPYMIQASYVEETYCNYKTILNVSPLPSTDFSMKYLVGLLNSRLHSFLFPYVSNKIVAQSFPRISVGDLKKLPIRAINFSKPADKARHDRMAALVDQMMAARRQLALARTEQEREFYERKCAAVDGQIDALVYELYGLTPEEVALVEAG